VQSDKFNNLASFYGLMAIQQSTNILENCLLNNHYATLDRHFLLPQQHILNSTRHQEFILINAKPIKKAL